jgi:hypothetical protein
MQENLVSDLLKKCALHLFVFRRTLESVVLRVLCFCFLCVCVRESFVFCALFVAFRMMPNFANCFSQEIVM